ncbi:MAG: hypothetical protein ISR65_12700 [Bacteriovoracaceae bacterium]|nr:hypothetical protein [Bacteriovoracaceae bacterium]
MAVSNNLIKKIIEENRGGFLVLVIAITGAMSGFLLIFADQLTGVLKITKKKQSSFVERGSIAQVLAYGQYLVENHKCVNTSTGVIIDDPDSADCSLNASNKYNLLKVILFDKTVNDLRGRWGADIEREDQIIITIPKATLKNRSFALSHLYYNNVELKGLDSIQITYNSYYNPHNEDMIQLKITATLKNSNIVGNEFAKGQRTIILSPRFVNTISLALNRNLVIGNNTGNNGALGEGSDVMTECKDSGRSVNNLKFTSNTAKLIFDSPVFVNGDVLIPKEDETSSNIVTNIKFNDVVSIGGKIKTYKGAEVSDLAPATDGLLEPLASHNNFPGLLGGIKLAEFEPSLCTIFTKRYSGVVPAPAPDIEACKVESAAENDPTAINGSRIVMKKLSRDVSNTLSTPASADPNDKLCTWPDNPVYNGSPPSKCSDSRPVTSLPTSTQIMVGLTKGNKYKGNSWSDGSLSKITMQDGSTVDANLEPVMGVQLKWKKVSIGDTRDSLNTNGDEVIKNFQLAAGTKYTIGDVTASDIAIAVETRFGVSSSESPKDYFHDDRILEADPSYSANPALARKCTGTPPYGPGDCEPLRPSLSFSLSDGPTDSQKKLKITVNNRHDYYPWLADIEVTLRPYNKKTKGELPVNLADATKYDQNTGGPNANPAQRTFTIKSTGQYAAAGNQNDTDIGWTGPTGGPDLGIGDPLPVPANYYPSNQWKAFTTTSNNYANYSPDPGAGEDKSLGDTAVTPTSNNCDGVTTALQASPTPSEINPDFSPGAFYSWNFRPSSMKFQYKPKDGSESLWESIYSTGTESVLNSLEVNDSNESIVHVYSILDKCVVKSSANQVMGFMTCRNLIIESRSTPLEMIGSFIVDQLTISPSVTSTITWRTVYHPGALVTLKRVRAMGNPLDENDNISNCYVQANSPTWNIVSADLKKMDRFEKCAGMFLAKDADPFNWTSFNPHEGITEAGQIINQRKADGLTESYSSYIVSETYE